MKQAAAKKLSKLNFKFVYMHRLIHNATVKGPHLEITAEGLRSWLRKLVHNYTMGRVWTNVHSPQCRPRDGIDGQQEVTRVLWRDVSWVQ